MPNPASDRVAYTYPERTESGTLETHDGQGRLVRGIAPNGHKGQVETTVQGLPAGLYSVRLLLDGFNLGSAKFTVMR